MLTLDGKTILLTGASGGIGKPTTKILSDAGAFVVAHYCSHESEARLAVDGLDPERTLLLHADFREVGSSRRLWADALAWRGRVDVLINNAAIMPDTPLDEDDAMWDENWRDAFQVNVFEPASLTREAVKSFRLSGGGAVISLSSWAAQQGSAIPHLGAYAATKAAIKAFTQTIARAHAKDGVLAYVVAPGIVDTPMSSISARARGGEDALLSILPLRELVPPSEVGELIAFLATGRCRHLSGATIDINGAAYVR